MTHRQPIDLSYTEALTLHSSLRQQRRRKERLVAKKPPFVPEPGKRDAGLGAIERYLRLEDTLHAFIATFPQYDEAEWIDDES